MLRIVVVIAVALAATPLWGSQARQKIERKHLEWFKGLSPEKKKELREKLESIKKLPPEERQRLIENLKRWRDLPDDVRQKLQDKMQALTPDEKKIYADLTQKYFREIGIRSLKAFPRELFFAWLKHNHPAEIERIRYIGAEERKEQFERFHEEFRQGSLKKAAEHILSHKCLPAERIDEVRAAAGPDFWVKLGALMQDTRAKHGPPPRKPGEIRDRKLPPPKRESK